MSSEPSPSVRQFQQRIEALGLRLALAIGCRACLRLLPGTASISDDKEFKVAVSCLSLAVFETACELSQEPLSETRRAASVLAPLTALSDPLIGTISAPCLDLVNLVSRAAGQTYRRNSDLDELLIKNLELAKTAHDAIGLSEQSFFQALEHDLGATDIKGLFGSYLYPTYSDDLDRIRKSYRNRTRGPFGDDATPYIDLASGHGFPFGFESTFRRVWMEFAPPASQDQQDPAPPKKRPRLDMLDDSPAVKDLLGFDVYADALAQLMQSPDTKTPLTVAINAAWGAGKSTLGRMIEERITKGREDAGYEPYTVLWFNAWMHDDAENLASAFAAEVTRAASKARPAWTRIFRPLPFSLWRMQSKRLLIGIITLLSVAAGLLLAGAAWDVQQNQSLNIRIYTEQLHVPWLRDFLIDQLKGLATVKAGGIGAALFALVSGSLKLTLSSGKKIAEYVSNPGKVAGAGTMSEVREQLTTLIEGATREEPLYWLMGSRLGLAYIGWMRLFAKQYSKAVPGLSFLLRFDTPESVKEYIDYYRRRRRRRFVVFVDDLERCKPPRSLDVLEVLNQLLSQEHVVTVILADMSSIAADAGVRHKDLATALQVGAGEKTPLWSTAQSFGRKYLQKIVQLQFDLPSHTPEALKAMVLELAKEEPTPEDTIKGVQTEKKPSEEIPKPRRRRASVGLGHQIVLAVAGIATLIAALSTISIWVKALFGLGTVLLFWYEVIGGYRAVSRANLAEQASGRALEQHDKSAAVAEEATKQVQAAGEKVDSQLAAEIKLLSKSAVLQDTDLLSRAYEVAFNNLPELPRNAKRLVNGLRLMLYIAVERDLFEQNDLTPEQVGKWAAMRERWPDLCSAIHAAPSFLATLEGSSGLNVQKLIELTASCCPVLEDAEELLVLLTADPRFASSGLFLATLSRHAVAQA